MRKKGLAIVLAASVAALSVGTVACGGEVVDDITADTNPADIVSDEVADAAAWRTAFDYSGRTNFSYKETCERSEDGQVVFRYSTVCGFNPDKYSYDETNMVVFVSEQENEQGETVTVGEEINNVYKCYAAVIDEKNYEYEYDSENDAWYRSERNYDVMDGKKFSLIELYGELYNGYERFRYADGVYVGEFEDEYITEYSVKIKYGRVVYISYVSRMENEEDPAVEEIRTLFIYDIDKTTVTLPTSFKNR
ncbi:MAG: hypothetical protein HDT28_00910 [Clostridiales bacterium]|nr:hypothetical protein [Clostridiales bacterium]